MAKKETKKALGEFVFETVDELKAHLLEVNVDEATVCFHNVFDEKMKCVGWTYEYK